MWRHVARIGLCLGLAATGRAADPSPPPSKLAQPFVVLVVPAAELTLSGSPIPKEVADSVADVREHVLKKRDWLRLADTLEQAEVVVEITGRGREAQHGNVIEGRLMVFDLMEGDRIIGQGGLDRNDLGFKFWRQAASDMSDRLVKFLKDTYHVTAPLRDNLTRPGAVLATRRGNAQLANGQQDAALASWDQALRLGPKYVPALRNRGLAMLARGEHEQAIRDLDSAISLDPGSVEAYIGRARAHAALGHKAKAQDDRRTALQGLPDLPAAGGSGADAAGRTAKELEQRGAEIETLREETRKQKAVLGSGAVRVREREIEKKASQRDALAAALKACEAGDKALCGALGERLKSGVARLVEPARD